MGWGMDYGLGPREWVRVWVKEWIQVRVRGIKRRGAKGCTPYPLFAFCIFVILEVDYLRPYSF